MALAVLMDYVSGKRVELFISADVTSDLDEVWRYPDALLRDLQHHAAFRNRRRWCDLDPVHFKLMIERNVAIFSDLPENEALDLNHEVTSSLTLLIAGLMRCLMERTQSAMNVMMISRLSRVETAISWSADILLDQRPEGRAGFEVVIDNTKED